MLIALITFFNTLYAQVSLQGVLLERGTRTPLKDVNVYILPHKLKSTTNSKGEFKFEAVPEGKFEFIVNNSGYIRLKASSDTTKNNTTLYLEKEFYTAFETTVTAKKEKKDVAQKTLSQKDFIKAPGAQEDPLKAIQNLPGIANQSASAQVIIQGSAPDDTQYALNGHEIPIAFHFGGISSIIMPQAIEDVEFLASGFGPEYGRVVGGVINLRTRPPKKDRLHGMAFVDIFNTGGLIEGPINEKSSFFLSARQSYIGDVIGAIAEGNDNFNFTVAPTFSDLFFQYEYDLSDKDDLSLTVIRSKDELQFVVSEPFGNDPFLRGDFYQRTDFFRIIPRWKRKLNDKQKLDISVGYGDNDITFEVGDNFFKLDTTTITTRAEVETKVNDKFTNYIGFDGNNTSFDVGLQLPRNNDDSGVRDTTAELTQLSGETNQNALYVRNRYQLTDKWILFPNARVERFEATDEAYLMPRFSASYIVDDSLTLSGAYGVYYQAPQNGEAANGFGNPDLNSERSQHYTLSASKDFRKGSSNGFVLDLDLFYKRLDQLIITTADTNSDGSRKVYSNEGTGDINGLQALVKYKKDEWSAMLAYTYLVSTRNEPTRESYPSEFDQTHNLNLIASYERSRWSFSGRVRYVTGRPFTPVDGALFDGDNDVYVPINGQFLSQRFSPFFQLDLRVDRKWVYDTWILSAYLDIQNVTNNSNVENISYNFDYSEEVETMGLPIIPIFGVKGEF